MYWLRTAPSLASLPWTGLVAIMKRYGEMQDPDCREETISLSWRIQSQSQVLNGALGDGHSYWSSESLYQSHVHS